MFFWEICLLLEAWEGIWWLPAYSLSSLKFAYIFHSLWFGTIITSFLQLYSEVAKLYSLLTKCTRKCLFPITCNLLISPLPVVGGRGENLAINRILDSWFKQSQVPQCFRPLPLPPASTKLWPLGACKRGLWGGGRTPLITVEVKTAQTHTVLTRRTWTGDCWVMIHPLCHWRGLCSPQSCSQSWSPLCNTRSLSWLGPSLVILLGQVGWVPTMISSLSLPPWCTLAMIPDATLGMPWNLEPFLHCSPEEVLQPRCF